MAFANSLWSDRSTGTRFTRLTGRARRGSGRSKLLRAVLLAAPAAFAVLPVVVPGSPVLAQEASQDARGSLFLDGLATTTPVGVQVSFAASLTNDGPGAAVGVRTLMRITLAEAGPQDVRIDRREFDGTWATVGTKVGSKGDVRFVDDSTTDLWVVAGGVLTGRYRLTFLSRTQPGVAIIAAEVQHRVGREWRSLARSPQYQTTVVAAPAPVAGGVSGPAGTQASSAPTPFKAAPTLAASASPIVADVDTESGDVGGSDPSGKRSIATRIFSSRVNVGLCFAAVLGMLAIAVWLLYREVSRGAVGSRRFDGR